MSNPQELVTEFHQKFGMPVGTRPEWVTDDRGELRWDLIQEEINEASDAYYLDKDLPNLAKELADVVYVVYGMAIELGIPLDEVVAAVHESNMSKLQADGTVAYREDGKVLKGPHYAEPDIKGLLGL